MLTIPTDLIFRYAAHSLLQHAKATSNSEKITADPQLEEAEEDTEDNENINNKGTWSYDETISLINSMETHMEELNHPKKKKRTFENVANDLISNGYKQLVSYEIFNKGLAHS